jgi:hypothetical protein
MSSIVCGLCNQDFHQNRDSPTGFCGQIWTKEVGFHRWQAPTRQQIQERLRQRYELD